ncbi:sucrase ferredoxin [Prauserella sp. PE36]|nr:sucrase ferredoxin [Prauserella sp. PE36]
MGCAAIRQACGEPLIATAPESASAWLLVEHPGPWPATGSPPGLPPEVLRMREQAAGAGIRWHWIRSVRERHRPTTTVFAAGTHLGGTWIERATLTEPRELAGLDLGALAEGRPPGFGERGRHRVVVVCTHGRRDVCCARLGRPVAERLDRRMPGQVWESTHLGGHRFAACVVTLPDAVFHGGVTPADTPTLADAITAGHVVPGRLRGRAGLPAPVQAAEHFARVHYGIRGVDGVLPLRHEPVPDGTVRVELALDDGTACVVHVRARRSTVARPTSCAAPEATATPGTFELVALHCRQGAA